MTSKLPNVGEYWITRSGEMIVGPIELNSDLSIYKLSDGYAFEAMCSDGFRRTYGRSGRFDLLYGGDHDFDLVERVNPDGSPWIDPERNTCFMTTITGREINLLNPREDDINIYDIATGLSTLVRFNGQRQNKVTVAEHCIIGSFRVPQEHALAFLLHDASEAYLSDLHGPLKDFLPDYRRIEAKLQEVISRRFDVGHPLPECCVRVDNELRIEEDDNVAISSDPCHWKDAYLMRFFELGGR